MYKKGDLILVREPIFVSENNYHRVGIIMSVRPELEPPFYDEKYYYDVSLYEEHPPATVCKDEDPRKKEVYVPLYLVVMYNGMEEEFFNEEIELISPY